MKRRARPAGTASTTLAGRAAAPQVKARTLPCTATAARALPRTGVAARALPRTGTAAHALAPTALGVVLLGGLLARLGRRPERG